MKKSGRGLLIGTVVLLILVTCTVAQPHNTQGHFGATYVEAENWVENEHVGNGTNDISEQEQYMGDHIENQYYDQYGQYGQYDAGDQYYDQYGQYGQYDAGDGYAEDQYYDRFDQYDAGDQYYRNSGDQHYGQYEGYHGIHYSEKEYWQAQENYLKARQEYLASKNRYTTLENEVVFKNAKDYISSGCLFIENWLGKLIMYIEASSLDEDEKENLINKADAKVGSFKKHRNDILNAKTPDKMRDITQMLRNSWFAEKHDAKSLVHEAYFLKLNKLIQRAEQVEMRFEGNTILLNQAGYDTTELESILYECSRNLNLANESLSLALKLSKDDTWSNCNCKESEFHLKIANSYIKMAFSDLKEFLTEYKSIQAYIPLSYENKDEVWIHNNHGNITMNGSGIINTILNGTLSVSPSSVVMSATGVGSSPIKSNTVGKVANFKGNIKAVVRGTNATVKIHGTNIKFFAQGIGAVFVDGDGTYRTKRSIDASMSDEIPFSNKTLIELGKHWTG